LWGSRFVRGPGAFVTRSRLLRACTGVKDDGASAVRQRGGAQPRTPAADASERGWVIAPDFIRFTSERRDGAPPSRVRARAGKGFFDVQHLGDQRLGSRDPGGADRAGIDF